jgi:hypothetical protein
MWKSIRSLNKTSVKKSFVNVLNINNLIFLKYNIRTQKVLT